MNCGGLGGIAAVLLTGAIGCAPSIAAPGPGAAGPPRSATSPGAARLERFAREEAQALGWLAAADPRLAVRIGKAAPDSVLQSIGTEAVLAEDKAAQIHDGSLDLFAFRARARALSMAASQVLADSDPLPEVAGDGAIARPRLERELLVRLIEGERARAEDEASLGSASGDLVRAMLVTWTPPTSPDEGSRRDAWVSKHLLEIRDSLRKGSAPTRPFDLDVALYPLERLLAPLQFPRGSAAVAELRVAMDEDVRASPPLVDSARLEVALRVQLGVGADVPHVRGSLERTAARLREMAKAAVLASASSSAVETRARDLLFIERSCPPVPGSAVRTMAPPPERAALCGALAALYDEGDRAAALVALHDDVLLALAAVTTSPPPRSNLLSRPDDDRVDAFRRAARERPVPALSLAIGAALVAFGDGKGSGVDLAVRLAAWRALGDAPLDVVARELGATLAAAP